MPAGVRERSGIDLPIRSTTSIEIRAAIFARTGARQRSFARRSGEISSLSNFLVKLKNWSFGLDIAIHYLKKIACRAFYGAEKFLNFQMPRNSTNC